MPKVEIISPTTFLGNIAGYYEDKCPLFGFGNIRHLK
jgi:hypothetical protein